MQVNPKPNNYGGIIAVLGLTVLVASLVIMLVLPEIQVAAWAVMATGVVLLAIALIINFRQVRGAVTGRRGRFGIGTGIMASIFIGIIVIANALSIGYYQRIDTSSLSRFTLTPQTVEVLEELDTPVNIIGFFVPGDKYGITDYVSGFLTEYASHSGNLTIKYVDPDKSPDQANKYGVTEYQTVVFESGDKRRLVPPEQYITLDSDGNMGIQAEHPFTSALLEVSGQAQKKVYFLTGNDEASIDATYSDAREGLLNDLYAVDTVNLLTDPAIPDDCAALIIAAPQNQMTQSELGVIAAYLLSGGQVMVLTDPDNQSGIEELVSLCGLDIGSGTIIDPGSSVSPREDMPLVTSDRNCFDLPAVYFVGAAALFVQEEALADVEMELLAYSTSSSWLDKDFTVGEDAAFDSATEQKEPLAIGVLIASTSASLSGKYMRLVVIGDSDFANNQNYSDANNSDLFLNSVSWLADETSLISIRRNVQPFRRLVVNAQETSFITYSSVALLPAVMLVTATVIWWRRR